MFVILPPPEDTHASELEAEMAVHAWTKVHGFNVSRRKAIDNDYGIVVERFYICDRAGKPTNTRNLQEQDRRRTLRGSKRIGCPMRLKIRAIDPARPD